MEGLIVVIVSLSTVLKKLYNTHTGIESKRREIFVGYGLNGLMLVSVSMVLATVILYTSLTPHLSFWIARYYRIWQVMNHLALRQLLTS